MRRRFPYPERDPDKHAQYMSELYTVVVDDGEGEVAIGYMLRSVFQELLRAPVSIKGEIDFLPARGTVSILRDQATEKDRTAAMAALGAYWRSKGTFRILDKWRDEPWPVYGRRRGELLFSVERMALGLLGGMRYGVHMTAYTVAPGSSHGLKIWVARRAVHKSSYPGMLDNTVAGGLMTGEDPLECMVREADEEAALPEDVMRARLVPAGTVSYIYITDERSGGEPGYIYPECQWVYDLPLPADVTPTPKDGEVEGFSLCTVEEIREQMARGLYKPNCAVVMLDFFIRHGILTRDNEPDYDEIVRRAHRIMPFPGPHRESEQQQQQQQQR